MTDSDRAIEEVRRSRRQMSERCGHDPVRLIQYLQDFNRRYAAQIRRYQESHRGVGTMADAAR